MTRIMDGASAVVAPLALALALATPGCGTDEPVEQQTADVEAVSLEWFAGFCGGYCRGTTDVASDLQGSYVERPYSEDLAFPPKSRSFVVAPADWQRIRSLARTAAADPWEVTYGCPDCVDQGGWNLTVRLSSGESRTTTLDNSRAANPAALEAVLEAVHALNPDTPLGP